MQQIQREKPDIILTDVVMPVMDGIELTRTVYEQYSDIRVILLSGHEEFEYVKKAMEYHACDYLLKPARMEKLLEVVLRVKEEILAERKKKADEELFKDKAGKEYSDLTGTLYEPTAERSRARRKENKAADGLSPSGC